MALKLKAFGPEHLSTLNRWAETQENTVSAHDKQLENMRVLLQKLFDKNPDLNRP